MFIHKTGYKIILTSFLVISIIAVLLSIFSHNTFINSIFYCTGGGLFLWIMLFFRCPKRKCEINEKDILCPADGKIVAIEEIHENEYFKEKRLQVSVFMGIFNVHVNRYPISGTVKYAKYHPGSYLVAWHPKASLKNEMNTLVIENENNLSVLVRQIAGFLARRIVFNAKPNHTVYQGGELGFIKFGSRVDLFLPLNIDIKVKLNQKVKGGKTIIASLK